MIDSTDIAVVGGGPVGLTAALLLAESGRRVVLLAPEPPGPDRRTSALLGDSISLLERAGVWDNLAPAVAPLRTIRIVDATRRLIRAPEVTFEADEIGRDAFGYNVPNALLVAALNEKLAAAGVISLARAATAARHASDTATLLLDDGTELAARLVVAADGRRSTMRGAAGIEARTWRYPQSALVCNLTHEADHRDASVEFHTENGPLTFVPLPPGEAGRPRCSLVWVDKPDAVNRRMEASAAELAAEISHRSSWVFGAVEVEGGVRQAFPLGGLSVDRFADRRIALAGEAAHVFPPIGAQGLNLGYRDAAAAVRAFGGPDGDPGTDTRLAAYNRDRLTDVRLRTAAVDGLNRSLLAGLLPAQILRGLGLFALGTIPTLRRGAMALGLGTTETAP